MAPQKQIGLVLGQSSERGVGIVVFQNLQERRAVAGHIGGTTLAETNAMSHADSLQYYGTVLMPRRIGVTGKHFPSQLARQLEAGLLGRSQVGCVGIGDSADPLLGVTEAIGAGN